MIAIGSATISADQSRVTIDSPNGFGAFRAVRLTNYTANVLVLTNIDGTGQGQSQELLLPLQQMVYHSVNVQAVPTITVFGTEGQLQVAPSVLVEWATEPLKDFEGTYPVTIGTPSAVPYAYVSLENIIPGGDTSVIGANPFRRSITVINQTPGGEPPNLSGIYWATSNLPAWNSTTAPNIIVGSGRTVDSTAALYFMPAGNAVDGTYLEIIEESWGAKSLFYTIGNI